MCEVCVYCNVVIVFQNNNNIPPDAVFVVLSKQLQYSKIKCLNTNHKRLYVSTTPMTVTLEQLPMRKAL